MIHEIINKHNTAKGKPVITKEELIERYGVKFIMYLYMEYTLLYEVMPEFEKKNQDISTQELGKKIIEEFGEIVLARYLISLYSKQNNYIYVEAIIEFYDELIFQDMINFLND